MWKKTMLALIVMFAIVLTACAPAATEAPPAAETEAPPGG